MTWNAKVQRNKESKGSAFDRQGCNRSVEGECLCVLMAITKRTTPSRKEYVEQRLRDGAHQLSLSLSLSLVTGGEGVV